MKTLLCILAMAALVLAAPADVNLSGKWTGSFDMTSPDGEAHNSGIVMVLKHSGSEVTGTAGPEEGEQYPIKNGKVEGDKITLEVHRAEGQVIKFDLAMAGDRIKGGAHMEANGETRTAKVDVGRAK